jgi:2-keto-3-deoxy-6-phosphogluconate aldolase
MLKRELPDVVVGAGTVLTVEQMQQSIDAGADFLVTPGTPRLADALAAAAGGAGCGHADRAAVALRARLPRVQAVPGHGRGRAGDDQGSGRPGRT